MKELTTLMRQEHIEASQDTTGIKEDSFYILQIQAS